MRALGVWPGPKNAPASGFLGEGLRDARPNCQITVSARNDSTPAFTTVDPVLLLVEILKLIVEIALMALVGQWVLGLLAGAKRETNFFYRVLAVMTRPFVRLARLLSPRIVLDRHVPLVAFLLLAFGWFVVTAIKINICLEIGVEHCK